MSNFLTLQYWFNSRPSALESGAQKAFLVFSQVTSSTQTLVVINNSSLGTPHFLIAFPTATSFLYEAAVSISLYPLFIASITLFSHSSKSVIWKELMCVFQCSVDLEAEFGTEKYPKPIVEHSFAKDRALKIYGEAVK